jgi:hypothetical protein
LRFGLGDIPYQCQDGQCEAQHDIAGASGSGGGGGGGMYSGGTEAVTVSSPGYSYEGPQSSVQYSYTAPYSFPYDFQTPGYTTNYFNNIAAYQTPAVEAVTVSAPAPPAPQEVQAYYQTPPFNIQTPGYSPNYFDNIAAYQTPAPLPVEEVTVSAQQPQPVQVQTNYQTPPFNIFAPTYPPDYFSQPQTEAVTVSNFKIPDPVQVQLREPPAPVFTPWAFEGWTPKIPTDQPDPKKKPAGNPSSPRGMPTGGGASGGGGGQQQQKPPQQTFNIGQQQPQQQQQQLSPAQLAALLANNRALTPQQQAALQQQQPQLSPAQLAALMAANRGALSPQQQAALQQLSPAQLAALLQNPKLTPQQRAAVQQALAKKLAAPASAGGAGMSPAAAQKAAAVAASPFQSKAAVLPAILIGGVIVAYGVTHRREISKRVQVAYSSARRRVQRAIA